MRGKCGGNEARTGSKLPLAGRLTLDLGAKPRKEIRTEVSKKAITVKQNVEGTVDGGSCTMAVAMLVSVVLVCGVVSGYGPGDRVYDTNGEPFRGHYPRPAARKSSVPFSFRTYHGNTRQHTARAESSEEASNSQQSEPRYNHGEMYPVFIPVKFDLNKNIIAERSLAKDDSPSSPNSPRLIMDKDFNIRFDNPYIIPLTKPLALVLDSVQRSREGVSSGDKVMIPFPVLVKSRKQPSEREYRSGDTFVEHRSNDEDDFFVYNSPLGSYRKGNSNKRQWKNATTTVHRANPQPKGKVVVPEAQKNPKTSNPKSTTSSYHSQEDVPNDSSKDASPSDVYPGKIFAEMYQTIPRYPLESLESEEFGSHQYDETKKGKYPQEVTTAKDKVMLRPRIRPTSRYPFGGHVFSATTDLEWVTQGNSSKAKRMSTVHDQSGRRVIIHDVEEASTTTTAKPEEVQISKEYWRDM